ncbi:MAG: nucleotidyltransferase domain-containing protein [Elusimicrobiota bacterium]
MDEKDKELVLEFKKIIPVELGKHLKRLIVFGSRVRGEATENSDLDVVVLVDEKTSEIERQFEDAAYQVMWDHNFKPMISLKVFAQSQFYDALNKGFSFYLHVADEGVTL